MFPPRTIIRSIVACALACGLLATMTSAAAGLPIDDLRADAPTSSLAGTTSTTPRTSTTGGGFGAARDYWANRKPSERPPAYQPAPKQVPYHARMQEQHYSSYGEPKPVTTPAPAAPATSDSPWLLISVIAGGLALVLASAALIMRRRRPATV